MLKAANLHKTYQMGRSDIRVLRGATLAAEKGEFVAVMGSSGSGKSTLLHLLGALDIPDHGTVHFNGRNIFESGASERGIYRNRDVGFVFQFYHLLPELSVLENVMLPRLIPESVFRWRSVKSTALRDAGELLERTGLTDRAKHRPRELSGGERQRVAICRALINRPTLLLADEPTGNLDETIGADILALLTQLNKGGQTIVMVTHDPKVAQKAHRRVQLTDGVLHEGDDRARRGGTATGDVRTRKVTP